MLHYIQEANDRYIVRFIDRFMIGIAV